MLSSVVLFKRVVSAEVTGIARTALSMPVILKPAAGSPEVWKLSVRLLPRNIETSYSTSFGSTVRRSSLSEISLPFAS